MTGGMHPHPEALYYHIAADSTAAGATEQDEFKRKQFGAIAIVFAALCLEAFINQEYERLHLELGARTSLRTKWLSLPRRLGLTSFDEKSEPFSSFEELIAIRNERLVHFKPGPETRLEGSGYEELYFGDLVGDPAVAAKYFECCGNMIRELNRITDGKTELPGFLSGQKYMSRVWASVTMHWESLGPEGEIGFVASGGGAA
jgi:hypothetical protein